MLAVSDAKMGPFAPSLFRRAMWLTRRVWHLGFNFMFKPGRPAHRLLTLHPSNIKERDGVEAWTPYIDGEY